MVASVFLQSKRLHGGLGPKLEHEEIVERSKEDIEEVLTTQK
jgi:hypothetical protein